MCDYQKKGVFGIIKTKHKTYIFIDILKVEAYTLHAELSNYGILLECNGWAPIKDPCERVGWFVHSKPAVRLKDDIVIEFRARVVERTWK